MIDREFVLIWKNARQSQTSLGYELTITWLQEALEYQTRGLTYSQLLQRELARIEKSYPDQDEAFHVERLKGFEDAYHALEERLALAQQRKGETIFDMLVALILEHQNVELRFK